MAITKIQLIQLASSTVNNQFAGNPAELQSFIDKLNQIKDVMETEEFTAVNFIKGR